MNPLYAALAVGVLAVAAYFIVRATSNTASSCSGDWSDWFNPACILQSTVAGAENEVNTLVIIVVVGLIVIVGLLAFGSSSGAIAGALAPSFHV